MLPVRTQPRYYRLSYPVSLVMTMFKFFLILFYFNILYQICCQSILGKVYLVSLCTPPIDCLVLFDSNFSTVLTSPFLAASRNSCSLPITLSNFCPSLGKKDMLNAKLFIQITVSTSLFSLEAIILLLKINPNWMLCTMQHSEKI